MKNFIFILCLTLNLYPSVSKAQNDKIVKMTVQRATVFQQGALLNSTEIVNVPSGTSNIIFENVSPHLAQNSIQAISKNDLVIMDIQYHLKYIESKTPVSASDNPKIQQWQKELQAVKDSLDDLNFVKKDIQNKVSSLQAERNILVNNRMMRGDFQKDSLSLFIQSIDFLRKRQNDIDTELLKWEKEAFKENRLRNQLNTRVTTLTNLIHGQGSGTSQQALSNQPVPQIIVTVMAERPMSAEINLTYYVSQAGWTATYDLKASKENQSIELKHKATVFQNTGVDWKDVSLTLSTGDPNQNHTKPVLTPQYLGYTYPQMAIYQNAKKKEMKMAAAPQKGNQNTIMMEADKTIAKDEEVLSEVVERDGVADFTSVNQNLMRVEYEIKLKYTIESDNKAHNVVIQSKTIPAIYTYSVVPKLDADAFLMARVTDWEDMNLIAGTARIFFDNSYIGESYINPRNTNDTLLLNLGRDKSIVVTRTKVKDKCKEKILSDNHVQTHVYDISIRNTKNLPIRIVVEDQMPVTKESDIKIEYLDNSNARFNTETGKLVWDFNLKPKDTKKLTFSYEIKSPKEKPLTNL